jgi:hypothetical protein
MTIILPVLVYVCETWSLTLREEHRLRVFEDRVLRRIFGPKRDEVTGGWRKLHKEELHDLYSSPSVTRMTEQRMIGLAKECRTQWVEKAEYMYIRVESLWESRKGRGHKENLDVNGKIIIMLILEGWDGVVWSGYIRRRTRTGDEPAGGITF